MELRTVCISFLLGIRSVICLQSVLGLGLSDKGHDGQDVSMHEKVERVSAF
jgi:hypothetical protein